MRKMQVLGVELQDYSVREAMKKVDGYLRDGGVNTIAYITTRGLMAAQSSEPIKTFLQGIDLTIAADSDILRASEIENRNRVREIDNNEFMQEFLKKMLRQRKSIYLLTSTTEQLYKLEKGLRSYQPNLKLVGKYSLDTLEKDADYLINEINMQTPDVIISNISSPQREEFFAMNQMKLSVAIWLMLKDEVVKDRAKEDLSQKLVAFISKMVFRRKVERYQNEELTSPEKQDE